MAVSYSTRDGRLRLYDASASPGPYYLEIPFVGASFRGPIGRGFTAQNLKLDRGRVTALAHYQEGDDMPALNPVQIGWTFELLNVEPNLTKFKQAMNVDPQATWTVGTNIWRSTKGKSQVLGGGPNPTLFTTPLFTNAPRRRTVDVYVLYTDPTASGGDTGFRYAECEFTPDQQQLSETDTSVPIQVNASCYGAIQGVTAFPSGTAG